MIIRQNWYIYKKEGIPIRMPIKYLLLLITRTKTLSQWRSHWLVVSLLAAVCSTLAKETGIATFAVCLLSDSDILRLLQLRRSLWHLFSLSLSCIPLLKSLLLLFWVKYTISVVFYTVSKETEHLRLMQHNFTNSQHLLVIFGNERPYSIIPSWLR